MDRHDIGDVAEILLDYVENDRTFQSDRITTVPTDAYFDRAIWQREIDTVFKQVPLMLALTCELPKPGDYKVMDALGLPILITRDKAGVAHAFLNVCSHRGAPVANDGHGNCARFTCKYHSWTFGLDGKLLAVSDRAKFGDLDKSTRPLRALPCEERAGMIFVVLTPGAPIDVDGYFQGMLDDFEAADLKNWTYLGSREIQGANWKIAFDGYLEGYHFASLHPTTIHPRTPSNVTHYESFGPHIRIGFPQVSIGDLKDVPRGEWSARENKGFDFVRILFPNVSAFLAPEIAQIAQLFPGPTPEENRTVLTYIRREAPRDDEDRAQLEAMIEFLRDVTYKEDYLIGLELQKGLKAQAHDSIVLGRNERGNQFFHETLQWYMNGKQGPAPRI
ncbi:aromatic ring-hydroxylating oxygenase subunit alpha [Sphingomonas jatrophae]|uniref:Phenylpropionate dioxygenase, large terminal subunit n=1 Tax=Sphingomonas jatrophae TaxID=1166337 RepID=A0A1I6M226_9SPHN|nr:SRPBCC family protein [Sphingomonas jatrophae]SFS09552.1 Phenylpropionate dioxygenase, large terminal subunit [Sphingomonas jatrophae]